MGKIVKNTYIGKDESAMMDYVWIASKVILIYFLLIIILRFLGKREVGQLSIFDLVILLIIADIASIGIDNNEFFFPSMICLAVLAILQKILSLALLHISKLRTICDGAPTIIVYEGVLQIKNMRRELYTIDDLVCQMRLEHIMDITEIKMAILETNGTLSIFKSSSNDRAILPIILSGDYVKENLEYSRLSMKELDSILTMNKLKRKKIIYASLSEEYLTYFYKTNRKIEQIKGCILRIKSNRISN